MAETLSSSAEGAGSIPGWGIKIPHENRDAVSRHRSHRLSEPQSCRCVVGRGLSRTSSYLSHWMLQRAWSSSTGNLSVCWYTSWHRGLSENTPCFQTRSPVALAFLRFPTWRPPSGPAPARLVWSECEKGRNSRLLPKDCPCNFPPSVNEVTLRSGLEVLYLSDLVP